MRLSNYTKNNEKRKLSEKIELYDFAHALRDVFTGEHIMPLRLYKEYYFYKRGEYLVDLEYVRDKAKSSNNKSLETIRNIIIIDNPIKTLFISSCPFSNRWTLKRSLRGKPNGLSNNANVRKRELSLWADNQ